MQTSENGQDIHQRIHDIKSSLQSLLVANELAQEGKLTPEKKILLYEAMAEEINKINSCVNLIETDYDKY